MKRYKTLSAGFTLVELSIVLLIGGVLMMAGTVMLLNYLKESSLLTTQSRMQDIDNALIQYINVNGVLPCVASLKAAESSSSFGRQITAAGSDCYTAVSGFPGQAFETSTGRVVAGGTNGEIVMGAVPVRDLGLADQEGVDAWGDRFVYAVTNALTIVGSYDPAQGSISVDDSTGASVIKPSGSALYVIVSYGADRAGAYSIDGVSSATACPAGALETRNCTYPTNTFVKTLVNSNQAGTPKMYDDYVTYHSQINSTGTVPSGLVTQFAVPPYTTTICPAGWSVYSAGSACVPSGAGDYVCCQKN